MVIKSTEAKFVHCLLTKLPESFSDFCGTISLLPNMLYMNTVVGMLQDRTTRNKGAKTSLMKCFFMPKIKESGSIMATSTTNSTQDQQANQPTRSSLVIIVATKVTFN